MSKRKRILLSIAAILAVVAAGVIVYPFVKGDMETRVLDDAARAACPGQNYVKLSAGVTAFECAGPENGPVVVLIHGFTTPSFIWDKQFDVLVKEGFHVLRYDLYGRGMSDRPDIAYNADLFDRQLLELLDSQHFSTPAALVGVSMGGAIAVHFLDRHPERVRCLCLIAPAGFPLHEPLKYRALKWPGVGEWAMAALGDSVLSDVTRRMELTQSEADDYKARFQEQMKYKGFKRAILDTLRHYPLTESADVYTRAGKHNIPACLFWGDKDHVLPFEHHSRVEEAMPGIVFHHIPGGGHTTNYEHPESVNPELISFLKSH
jgi:pimeloyl-ACP methyl ester carboxylesterase